MIFDFAYARSPDVCHLCPSQWQRREMSKLGDSPSTYTVRPFPEIQAASFLISKKFFTSAAKAYVTSQPFKDGVRFATTARNVMGIVGAFATEVEEHITGEYHAECVSSLPNIRSLTVVLAKSVFEDLWPKVAFRDVLTIDEFRKLDMYKVLCRMSGLLEFKVVSFPCPGACCNSDTWKGNLKTFEAALTPHVMGPKKDPTLAPTNSLMKERFPSYPGSEVNFAISSEDPKLLKSTRECPANGYSNGAKCREANDRRRGAPVVEVKDQAATRKAPEENCMPNVFDGRDFTNTKAMVAKKGFPTRRSIQVKKSMVVSRKVQEKTRILNKTKIVAKLVARSKAELLGTEKVLDKKRFSDQKPDLNGESVLDINKPSDPLGESVSEKRSVWYYSAEIPFRPLEKVRIEKNIQIDMSVPERTMFLGGGAPDKTGHSHRAEVCNDGGDRKGTTGSGDARAETVLQCKKNVQEGLQLRNETNALEEMVLQNETNGQEETVLQNETNVQDEESDSDNDFLALAGLLIVAVVFIAVLVES